MKNTRFGIQTCLLFALVTITGAAHGDVKDIRVWQSPDNTRLVFDLSGPHEHKIFQLSNPERVVIDLPSAKLLKPAAEIDVASTWVDSIRSGKRGKNDLRIVLDMQQRLTPRSFPLPPNKKYPYHRLVVDLEKPKITQAVAEPIKRSEPSSNKARDIIIAIDAGHGGEDPGAIGPRGTQEKKVVLKIAQELESLLRAEPGFTPYMVRTGDYYIGLRARTGKAREANADFFVSLHADAFKHPSASGSSVFVLSERGATSETARWLADKENDSDLIGGVSLEGREDHLAMTLLDLSMTAKRESSVHIGSKILGRMKHISKLHKRQVEEANFAVLKAPDMPALLVETGFISNPGEERKLGTSAYRKKMARAVFEGVRDYFNRYPPRGTLIAARQQKSSVYHTYTIQRGDTLSAIAVRNGVGLTDLRRANNLKNDRIRIGQTLKIPKT
ncbi:N-acetylmuramoyl-L-alanine amidase [Bacterioplanes sanyensis]|uniref:N-acetylmuramoyl-L-alanine amidase AmiC n=1 Tax=Bacterioplanes sanyensis TaxID=1249553 RepID=A0A222FK60_9GAMM|nr:N-acetylmuramoyl-L-alanine amidase [Bacterioplanes sanyensis]ASP38894.1 N-acetylmuramoyl-L-alanine amidase [Bacterioplanes sanyensis]